MVKCNLLKGNKLDYECGLFRPPLPPNMAYSGPTDKRNNMNSDYGISGNSHPECY